MLIEVVQARGDASTALSLGHFAFGPIPEPRRRYPVEVAMTYDREGIVHVQATDGITGRQIAHQLADGSDRESDAPLPYDQQLLASIA
jgi:molecular chaperone DnaK (HSP70)